MTDRKLNEEMARLCGIPKRTSEETFGPGVRKTTVPFICGGTLFSPTDDRRVSERWDPANNLQQAWDYVVPVLCRMQYDVRILKLWDADCRVMAKQEGKSPIAKSDGNGVPQCKLLCLTALQAREEELEETT